MGSLSILMTQKRSAVQLGHCPSCNLCLVVSDEKRIRAHDNPKDMERCLGSNMPVMTALIGGDQPTQWAAP